MRVAEFDQSQRTVRIRTEISYNNLQDSAGDVARSADYERLPLRPLGESLATSRRSGANPDVQLPKLGGFAYDAKPSTSQRYNSFPLRFD